MNVLSLPPEKQAPPLPAALVAGAGAVGCLFALAAGVAPLYVWGGVVALALLGRCAMSPLKGLVLVVALSALFVRSTEEITLPEIVYGVLFGTVMLGWCARRLAAAQPFAPAAADRMLVWFLAVCVASAVPAFLYGNDMMKWLRELIPFLVFLPYLVIVTTLNRLSDLRWLCAAFLAVTVSMGVVNFYEYWLNVANARELWELIAGRRAPGEPLFFATLAVTMTLIAYEGFRGWRTVGYLALAVFAVVALAITFSRGAWVATLIALGVAVVLMPARRRWTVIKYAAGLGLLALVSITLFMGPLAVDIVTVMAERFGSILSAAVDLSLRNRLAESAEVVSRIAESPVFGYGLGYYYSFFPLIPYEMPTWYVHNAYLYIWLKLGLIGLVVFLVWYFTVLIHGYRLYRALRDPFLQPLILGVTSVMIAMLPLSVTSPQFIQKDSILFLALSMGIIERLYRNPTLTTSRRPA